MKLKVLLLAAVATLSSANAVSIGLTAIANSTVGFATLGATNNLASGTMYLFSSSTELTGADLDGILGAADPVAFFASKLTGTGPEQVRALAFTNGAFTSSGATEVGDAGNKLYMLIVATGNTHIGAYQNINAPSLGTVVMNPSNMTEDLLGTSTLQAISGTNSGYQLAAAVPEPSTALLGLLGVAGLIRRRR